MTAEAKTQPCPENHLSWFQVNNWVPIIGSAVMIALSWASLNTDVRLINQKLDTYIANQNIIIEKLAANQDINIKDIAALRLDLTKLTVKFNKGE